MPETTEVPIAETATVNGQTETNLSGSFLKTAKNILKAEGKSPKKAEAVVEEKTEEVKAEPVEIKTEVKEEIKTEPIVEKTTEEKTEAKVEEKAAEIPKAWYDDETATNGQAKETGKSAEEIDYKSKYNEVVSILSDPQIKTAIALRKQGKNITEIDKDIPDPTRMSLLDKKKWDLQQKGVSATTIDNALTRFSEMEEWEQEIDVAPITEKINQFRNSKLEEFGMKAEQSEQAQAQINTRAKNDYISHINELTDYNGVEITNERKAKLIEKFESGVRDLYNSDGSPNVKTLARIYLLDEFEKDLVKVNVRKALNDGKREILEKVIRTDSKNTADNRRMEADEKPTNESIVDKIIKSRQTQHN